MAANEDVVDEIVHRGPATVRRAVDLLGRGHRDGPGIDRETLDAYVEAVEKRRDFDFDAEGFYDEDKIYRLEGDRISRYPRSWHEELGGSDDVAAFVRFLNDTGFADTVGKSGAGSGIDEEALLDVAAAVGRISKGDAKARLETLRDEDVVVEDADTHPHGGVYLAEDASELRDPALDES